MNELVFAEMNIPETTIHFIVQLFHLILRMTFAHVVIFKNDANQDDNTIYTYFLYSWVQTIYCHSLCWYFGLFILSFSSISEDEGRYMCQSLCLFFSSLFLSEEVSSDLPPSREQRVEQKRFYFDVGSNTRGVYLRISEVRGGVSTGC